MIRIGFFNDFEGEKTILISVDLDGVKRLEKSFRKLGNGEIDKVEFHTFEGVDKEFNVKITGIANGKDSGISLFSEDFYIWKNSKATWLRFTDQMTGFSHTANSGHHYLEFDNDEIKNDFQIIISFNEYPKTFWRQHFYWNNRLSKGPILIPLNSIDENEEFWSGTIIRKTNAGMNVKNKADDFYDYILAYANWDSDSMMLVNITEQNSEAGSVYGGVIPIFDNEKKVVNKKGFKHTLGNDLKNWYLILRKQ